MLTKLKLRFYGDACLRKKSLPVKDIGPAQRLLIQSMIQTMHEEKGIGLAAPQIGINERIFVVDTGEGDGPFALINPHIIQKKGQETMTEGCLSLPGINVDVKRAATISVEYLDEENRLHRRECTDLLARVIQHENDHLNGKLIIDYMSVKDRIKARKQLKQIKESSTEKKK